MNKFQGVFKTPEGVGKLGVNQEDIHFHSIHWVPTVVWQISTSQLGLHIKYINTNYHEKCYRIVNYWLIIPPKENRNHKSFRRLSLVIIDK
jgi:hypothetical protein